MQPCMGLFRYVGNDELLVHLYSYFGSYDATIISTPYKFLVLITIFCETVKNRCKDGVMCTNVTFYANTSMIICWALLSLHPC